MKKTFLILTAVLILVLFAPILSAATVTWGSSTTISGDTDVANFGTLSYAYYFANVYNPPAADAEVVNGVSFQKVTMANPYSVVSPFSIGGGNLTASGSSGIVSMADSNSNSSPYASLSASYQNILGGQLYDNNNCTLSLTLNNLTSGQSYMVQFWCNESRAIYGVETRTGRITAGGQYVDITYNTTQTEGGVGQWVAATFTADASSETFAFTGVSGDQNIPMLNAVQVRSVPEPSVCVLLGLAFLFVIIRQRNALIGKVKEGK